MLLMNLSDFFFQKRKKTVDKPLVNDYIIDMKTKGNTEMLMTFTEFDANAIDIKQAWMATNASKEVDIVLNTNNMFELWIESNFENTFSTFEEAVRNAESMVTMHVRWED